MERAEGERAERYRSEAVARQRAVEVERSDPRVGGRCVTRRATRSSARRRAAKRRTLSLGASSRWTSSTATRIGSRVRARAVRQGMPRPRPGAPARGPRPRRPTARPRAPDAAEEAAARTSSRNGSRRSPTPGQALPRAQRDGRRGAETSLHGQPRRPPPRGSSCRSRPRPSEQSRPARARPQPTRERIVSFSSCLPMTAAPTVATHRRSLRSKLQRCLGPPSERPRKESSATARVGWHGLCGSRRTSLEEDLDRGTGGHPERRRGKNRAGRRMEH